MNIRLHPVAALAAAFLFVGAAFAAGTKTGPVPTKTVSPAYPAALWDTGKEGQAVVAFTVTAEGKVADATVQSADDPAFGEAALAAVQQWEFTPATEDGVAVAKKVSLPLKFALPGEEKLNRAVGRKVFVKFDEPVMSLKDFGGSAKIKVRPPARFPEALKGQGITETVKIRFIVTKEGKVINPEVLGEPRREFVLPALMSVILREYEPPVKDGQPVNLRITTDVKFSETPAQPAAGAKPQAKPAPKPAGN